MKHISIAIDGPSGAGKSTLARKIAKRFGFLYVDTGAIYRTVALHAIRSKIDLKDSAALLDALNSLRVELSYGENGFQHMRLNGKDVTAQIRTPEVSMAASTVSAYPGVRVFLLETQRQFARENDVVMDGRDIGTMVLPNADLKIFLTASAEERAWRRTLELDQKGMPRPYQEVLEDQRKRDYNDANREIAPLRQAEDAVLLDTTHMTLAESEEALEKLIEERTGRKPLQERPETEDAKAARELGREMTGQ